MKHIYVLFIMIMMGSIAGFAQDFDITITASESSTKIHQARNSITFGNNYSYTPSGGTLTAEIVNAVVEGDASYITAVEPETRSLSTSRIVGTTSGSLNITPMGGANYTIPIDLPAGISGLSPILALNYNSLAGSGVAGYGWNLSGISAITRSPKTHYYDNIYSGVDLSSSDRFSLDGKRLICTSGTYGGNTSGYRTENDIFSKITCYTGTYGPDKFEVETKSGLTYEYGNTADSDQKVDGLDETLNWFVNKITDVYNNTIEFEYVKDEGVNYIGEITYGPNTITFFYKKRSDVKISYLKGKLLKQQLLLDRIEIKYNTLVVRKYTFSYAYPFANYNQHSVLNQVTEYGAGGSSYYNSTAFSYQMPDAVSFAQTKSNTSHSYITYKSDLYAGDFNGDGKADFLCLPNAYASWSGYKMYYGDGNGNFNYAYQNTSFSFGTKEDIRILDINSDGKDDILYETVSSGTSTFKYIKNTGSAFSSATTICTQTNSSVAGFSGKKNRKTFKQENDNEISGTDYNGDGINDIFINDASGNWKIYSLGNSSGSLGSSLTLLASGSGSTLTGQVVSGDFNGDGKCDLWSFGSRDVKVFEFTGSALSQLCAAKEPRSDYFFTLGDFNADGKSDLFFYGKTVLGTEYDFEDWRILLSNGDGFEIQYIPQKKANLKDDYVRIGDFNSDGASDIMVTSSNDSWNGTYCYISKGNGAGFHTEYLGSYPTNTHRFNLADFDGDGRTDFLCTDAVSSWWNGYHIYESGSKNNVLLEKIGNGLGHLTELSYQSIAGYGAPYTRGTGATFPVSDYQGPLQVVKSVQVDNGTGSQNTSNYTYQGLKIHKQGKGVLCMSKQTVTNTTTNNIQESNYSYHSSKYFPQLTSTVNKNGSTTLTTVSNNWAYHTPTSGVIFPYISSTTQTNSLTGHSVTTTNTYNSSNGNLTKVVTNYNNGFSQTVDNYFDSNTSYRWIGGRLTNTTVTHSKSGETSIVRETDFTYASDGKLKPDLIKYLDGTNWYSYKNNNYDSKGNLTQVSHSDGTNTRTSTYTYEANGVRVKTETDALGHQTEYFYDSYGRLNKEENYLNQETEYTYDVMGRETSGSTPDGLVTSISYNWGLSGGPSRAVYYIEESANDGSENKVWYDELGREIRTDTKNFSGSYNYAITEYNTKGQLYRISEPSTSTSPSQWNTHAYYNDGRISSVTRPSALNSTFTYSSNRVTETTGGKTSWKEYNSMGLVSSANDNGGTLTYAYYPDGSVKTITNGSIVTSMEYNLAGQRTKLVDPSAGTTQYTYNAFGQLKTQKNARNQTTTYNYHSDGRLDNIQRPGSEGTDDYTYNTDEQLTGISNSTTNVSRGFEYDDIGRVDKITETLVDATFNTTFTYYRGKLRTITHPTQLVETYYYNAHGYLSSVSAGGATYTVTAMNARQQITNASFGSSLLGEYGFDSYGYPLHIKAKVGSTYRQDLRYNFTSSTGNLYSRNDYKQNKTETFTYDNLNRLSGVSGPQNLTMGYDNLGNISTKSDLAPGNYTYGHSTKPYAVTEINSGNALIPTVDQEITYTSFEQPLVITESPYEATFTYNSEGQRAKMVVKQNSSTILTRWYAGGRHMKQTEGSTTKEFTWVGGTPYNAPILAVKEGSTTSCYYLLRDHLGTITHVTNTSGTTLNTYAFDAWGRRRNPTNWGYSLPAQTDILPGRGFTGHEYLSWFKLYNMNGRLYDPLVGRFLSPDNNISNPGNTQNYNRYSYCLNNPLKYIDPSGELQYLTQATTGTSEHRSRIDYSGHLGRGRHFNYRGDAIGGGGGSAGNSNSYTYTAGGYIDALGNSVSFDEVYQNQILPNAERNASVEYILYLGQGSWTDNNTGLLANPLGNVSVYASFNFNGNYSVKTNLGGANANYASSQGGLSLSDGNTGLGFVAGGGSIELGNKLKPFRPIRYNNGSLLRQGTIARNLNSGALMSGSRYLQTARGALYWTGAGAGVFGMGLSTYNYINGDISGARYGADMFFGAVGFMGPPGLMISTTYFIVTSPGFQQGVRDYHETKAKDFGPGGDWEHLNSDFFYRGGLCFAGGTEVLMGDGTIKPIEAVNIGDTVLTYDFVKEKAIKTEVLRTDAPMHDNLITISFSNKVTNTNTQDHPYFVRNKGWCSFNPTQSTERYGLTTSKLEIGDKCFIYQKGKLKKVKVTSIVQLNGTVKTYNLTGLKIGNSYFANGILVNSENPVQNKAVEKIKKGDKE